MQYRCLDKNQQIDCLHMTNFNYSKEEIKKKVNLALNILFTKDSFLLENSVHERSTAHKLAEYLQILFSDWNVDLDYNKDVVNDRNDPKQEPGVRDSSHSARVVPDIIIHKRGTNKHLLVIEIKQKKYSKTLDIKKLKEFTSPSGHHKYQLGFFIEFHSTEEPTEKWFKDGQEINF